MTISATHFKARCLELMNQVNRTRQPVIITKRGKVVARLVAAAEPAVKSAGIRAMYGYARTFRRKPRRTADWMRELREGERS